MTLGLPGLGLALLAGSLAAQSPLPKPTTVRRGEPRNVYVQSGNQSAIQNVPYDGRFIFARVRFDAMDGSFGFRRDYKWDHDTPRAERHFMKILRELSTMRPYMDGGNIFTLDDPDLFKFPVAYLSEPGYWTMSEKEVVGLRSYLAKGGFLIIDDFADRQWTNFEQQLRRVLPQARLVEMDTSHPIFDSFFRISSLEMVHPNFRQRAVFLGVFEDNDPKKRLIMIVNYNNDLGDYWEFSDTGALPIDISNEAYKLGVNYVMYALTH
jgi:hypothetical protein